MSFFWAGPRLLGNPTTISKSEYESLKKKFAAFERKGRGRPMKVEVAAMYAASVGLPGDVDARNRLTSQIEVYEFVHQPPPRYFLYVDEARRKAITWAGDDLGDVSFGREFKSNMGDRRVPITVRAINGRTYVGTYFKDSGNYARVRLKK